LVAAGLAAFPAQARFTQQDKLIGSGALGVASQGISVALSADGSTAIVGGFTDNGEIGAAWVFVRTGGVWNQQGGKLIGSDAVGQRRFGVSVALSADGNTAVVGGPFDNGGDGAAWVFVRSGGVWTQQGGKLVGIGAIGNANQGLSVAMSADGNTALVGGPADNGGTGAVWAFIRSGGVWTRQGGKLTGSGAVGPTVQQGVSVALSADGNTAVVGGQGDNGGIGAAWVFARSGGVWTQQGSKLVGSGAVGPLVIQGWSVALSADGNTAIVGGFGDNGFAGAAWVFVRAGGVWTQQGNKLVGSGAVGPLVVQGQSVALSTDGNTAVVGGPGDNGGIGAAWVFVRTGGVWTQQGNKLVGSGAVGVPEQGSSVALSADGNTAIVGGQRDDGFAGAAWVFGRPGITAISPNAGTVDGGTRVTIVGQNFFDVTGVTFGGVPATNVAGVNANTVRATTPPRTAGRVNVRVQTRTGGAAMQGAYLYLRHPTTMVLSSSVNPSTAGQRVTFTASVTADGGPASGNVIFSNGNQVLGTAALRGGVAKFTTAELAVGVHTIKASFEGNGNFMSSARQLRQRVIYRRRPTTMVLSSSANPSTFGRRVTFTASVTADGSPASGNVIFSNGNEVLGTVALRLGVAHHSGTCRRRAHDQGEL
jgi:hypothetical protein